MELELAKKTEVIFIYCEIKKKKKIDIGYVQFGPLKTKRVCKQELYMGISLQNLNNLLSFKSDFK